MLKQIKHAYNLLRHHLRDIGQGKRSGKWPTIEKHFLEEHPECEACGSKTRLNVHHCLPFRSHPELELDPKNLITLCMSMGKECHLALGHGDDFHQYNQAVREDVGIVRSHPERFEAIAARAKANRRQ